jgi:signal transduction histidine kinase
MVRAVKSSQKELRVQGSRRKAGSRLSRGAWPSDAEQTMAALLAGRIDALVIPDATGDNVYALKTFEELERANAQLRDIQQRLLTLINERERLMQDLHDGCIQSIYAVGLSLEGCRSLIREEPVKAAQKIGHAEASLNLVIQELRSFITPATRETARRDLRAEIKRMVQAVGARGPKLTVRLDDKLLASLPPDAALQLLQIAREGLSNIVRHAKARSGRVALSKRSGCVALEIADDGTGFDPQLDKGAGLGLHHIEARVEKIGAKLTVTSAKQRGTRIRVELPPTR